MFAWRFLLLLRHRLFGYHRTLACLWGSSELSYTLDSISCSLYAMRSARGSLSVSTFTFLHERVDTSNIFFSPGPWRRGVRCRLRFLSKNSLALQSHSCVQRNIVMWVLLHCCVNWWVLRNSSFCLLAFTQKGPPACFKFCVKAFITILSVISTCFAILCLVVVEAVMSVQCYFQLALNIVEVDCIYPFCALSLWCDRKNES